jgi:hypothetical protein
MNAIILGQTESGGIICGRLDQAEEQKEYITILEFTER